MDKVINVTGEGAGMKLTIEFPTQGVRVVMAKFAPVKKGWIILIMYMVKWGTYTII